MKIVICIIFALLYLISCQTEEVKVESKKGTPEKVIPTPTPVPPKPRPKLPTFEEQAKMYWKKQEEFYDFFLDQINLCTQNGITVCTGMATTVELNPVFVAEIETTNRKVELKIDKTHQFPYQYTVSWSQVTDVAYRHIAKQNQEQMKKQKQKQKAAK